MPAAWPDDLPQFVLEQGYAESLPDNVIESAVQGASPNKRRRRTHQARPVAAQLLCSPAQAALFTAFYQETLKGGTLPFTWLHPRTRAAMTARFALPAPVFGSAGSAAFVTVSLHLVIKA